MGLFIDVEMIIFHSIRRIFKELTTGGPRHPTMIIEFCIRATVEFGLDEEMILPKSPK